MTVHQTYPIHDEMLTGKSKLRNPILADILHKMGIIEKWGSGMRRIFARCKKAGVMEPLVNVGGRVRRVGGTRGHWEALR